ncbi:MAG TPA: glycosyltransferase [Longimicrobiales bacterium]
MAAAVLDFDLERGSDAEGLDRYDHALVLVRFRGRPVHQVVLPVVDGRVSVEEIRRSVLEAGGWVLWDRWLEAFLELETPARAPIQPATVAVCTRDRPDDLRRCLDALAVFARDGHEVLVVDNVPSTDESRQIVQASGFARYVREDRPGESAARNRALREASHDIVAFSDDDAMPDPGWLPALLRNFNDPLVLCVTGLTMPYELETEAQRWFERYSPFGRGFMRTVFDGGDVNPLLASRAGASANMAVRRAVLDLIGPFNEALGCGTRSRTGSDYEFFVRILAAGYRIVYDPAALSWHRHRRTWTELRQVLRGYGTGVYAAWTHLLFAGREFIVPKLALSWLLHTQLPNLLRSLLRRPGSFPLDLILAELRGCLAGPWAYVMARRALRRLEVIS